MNAENKLNSMSFNERNDKFQVEHGTSYKKKIGEPFEGRNISV